jgi:hypothetical protein
MTDRLSPQREAEIAEQMKQALSDAGAFCGECGFEPGDRGCDDCEWCYRRYVEGLMPLLRATVDAELAAVRAERDEAQRKLDARTEDVAFLERNTLPDLHRQIQHHQDGKKRWRDRAEKAEAEVTRMTLAEPELCSWCGHVEAAHSKDGSIDCNASGAEVAQKHQCPCTFFIPGGAA